MESHNRICPGETVHIKKLIFVLVYWPVIFILFFLLNIFDQMFYVVLFHFRNFNLILAPMKSIYTPGHIPVLHSLLLCYPNLGHPNTSIVFSPKENWRQK